MPTTKRLRQQASRKRKAAMYRLRCQVSSGNPTVAGNGTQNNSITSARDEFATQEDDAFQLSNTSWTQIMIRPNTGGTESDFYIGLYSANRSERDADFFPDLNNPDVVEEVYRRKRLMMWERHMHWTDVDRGVGCLRPDCTGILTVRWPRVRMDNEHWPRLFVHVLGNPSTGDLVAIWNSKLWAREI